MLRLESILYNGPHKLAFESWVGITNGETRLRLESILYNGPHKLAFERWVGKVSARGSPHFTAELCMFGPSVDASHSSWTVPMSYLKYNEWQDKVEIG
eukprot:scaffold99649_cov78-Cyclotella_meneghiniana.AAC.1